MLHWKNVFVLGAGFSAEAGAPVMGDFLNTAWALCDNPRSGLEVHHREPFTRIRNFLREHRVAEADITLDLGNVEQLFSLAEMDLQYGAGPGRYTREDIAFLITQTLERSLQPARLYRDARIITLEAAGRHQRQMRAHYGELFAGLASRRWLSGPYGASASGLCQDVIITMNYDCFLDEALIRVGVRPDYGFDKVTHYEGEPTRLKRSVSLLKLHGSTNWFLCSYDSCGRKGLQIWGHDPARRLDYLYWNTVCNCGRTVEPLIVPPTWAKSAHSEVLVPVWKRALAALQEAQQIIIIGYSMPETDAFFKYMLSLALASNEKLARIVVVNPNETVLRRYEQLFRENFRERKLGFPRANRTTGAFLMNGDLGNLLGQYGDSVEEGLDPAMILESGFEIA